MIDKSVKESGKRQSEIARLAKVDTSSLSRWRRGEQGCPAYRMNDLAKALNLNENQAATLLKLALEVEQENQKERDALRSPGLRGEIRELRESLKSLEDQVKQIREYVGFQPPQHCPDGHDRHLKPDIS